MGFTCVAEGAESPEQHDAVSTLNISYIQYYGYSPALPFKKWLKNHHKNLNQVRVYFPLNRISGFI